LRRAAPAAQGGGDAGPQRAAAAAAMQGRIKELDTAARDPASPVAAAPPAAPPSLLPMATTHAISKKQKVGHEPSPHLDPELGLHIPWI